MQRFSFMMMTADQYNLRGLKHYNKENFEEALADYNQAIEINSTKAYYFNNRGALYLNQGKLNKALADFNTAIELAPKIATFFSNRGAVYRKQDKFDEALADFNQAIALAPDTVKYYKNLGIEFDSDPAKYFKNRGNLYKDKGNFDEALADFNQAIALNGPEPAKLYNYRGDCKKAQGKLAEAIADYVQAIKLDPEYDNPINTLSLILEDNNFLKNLKIDLSSIDKKDFFNAINLVISLLPKAKKIRLLTECLYPDNPLGIRICKPEGLGSNMGLRQCNYRSSTLGIICAELKKLDDDFTRPTGEPIGRPDRMRLSSLPFMTFIKTPKQLKREEEKEEEAKCRTKNQFSLHEML